MSQCLLFGEGLAFFVVCKGFQTLVYTQRNEGVFLGKKCYLRKFKQSNNKIFARTNLQFVRANKSRHGLQNRTSGKPQKSTFLFYQFFFLLFPFSIFKKTPMIFFETFFFFPSYCYTTKVRNFVLFILFLWRYLQCVL